MTVKFAVVFDNGGGTTLMVGKRGFVHNYDTGKQCAEDVRIILSEGTKDWKCWEGHEPKMRFSYNYDEERNGGICWFNQDDVKEVMSAGKLKYGYMGHGWRNVEEFFRELGVAVEE